MKLIIIIYLICIIPTFLVYPTVKNLPPQNVPDILKFFMAWFIMPPFLIWKLYQKIFNKKD